VLGMYYYLRVIATMFMEQETTVASSVPKVPATPISEPKSARRVPAKARAAGGLTTSRSATAVAEKPSSAKVSKAVVPPATEIEREAVGKLSWMTWLSLSLAVIGTLAMGTVLPFWLVNLAQRAAELMMLR